MQLITALVLTFSSLVLSAPKETPITRKAMISVIDCCHFHCPEGDLDELAHMSLPYDNPEFFACLLIDLGCVTADGVNKEKCEELGEEMTSEEEEGLEACFKDVKPKVDDIVHALMNKKECQDEFDDEEEEEEEAEEELPVSMK